jgi:hypothetical protein
MPMKPRGLLLATLLTTVRTRDSSSFPSAMQARKSWREVRRASLVIFMVAKRREN